MAARPREQDRLVRMLKALGHPNRLRLFTEIREANEAAYEDGHDCFIHTIMRRLSVGAPTVSHHLKELVQAGLVTTSRQGKYLTCQVNPEAVQKLAHFFARSG